MTVLKLVVSRAFCLLEAIKHNRILWAKRPPLGRIRPPLPASAATVAASGGRFAMCGGIYQIKNQANGKCYIGSSVNVQRRWVRHLCDLRQGQHRNRHLQRAFNKYGESMFMFSMLEYVKVEMLIRREQHFLDLLAPEYNIAHIAGSILGFRHTPQTRKQMSNARRDAGNSFYGKRHTDKTKRKISEATIGKSHSNYGRPLSEEHRRKISEANKAYWHRVRGVQDQKAEA